MDHQGSPSSFSFFKNFNLSNSSSIFEEHVSLAQGVLEHILGSSVYVLRSKPRIHLAHWVPTFSARISIRLWLACGA